MKVIINTFCGKCGDDTRPDTVHDCPVIELAADRLRGDIFAIRPAGQLGTCGFYPVPWQVQYIRANCENSALRKAKPIS